MKVLFPTLLKLKETSIQLPVVGSVGKGSIESIKTVSIFKDQKRQNTEVSLDTIYQLSEKLLSFQNNFSATGGYTLQVY